MTNRQSARLYKLHRSIAPIVVLPLLLTVITGVVYQITDLSGREAQWLLSLHKGNFGSLKLEAIYPFLNGLGLLAMLATGTAMLLKARRHPRRAIGEE
jgi:hypothetical protein